MTRTISMLVAVLLLATGLTACLHEEESSVSVSVLDGEWIGYEENFNTGQINKVTFSIQNGSITSTSREDKGLVEMVDLGVVGTVTVVTGNVFAYEMTDNLNTLGVFFTDQDHNYITFVDDKFNFGVLQKSSAADVANFIDLVTGTPVVFEANDMAGSWVGYGANIRNGEMTVSSEHDSRLDVVVDTLEIIGSESVNSVTNGQYIGDLFQADVDRGVYRDNNWTNPVDVDVFGNLSMLLSPDKSYVAGRICLPVVGVADIEACSFLSLR